MMCHNGIQTHVTLSFHIQSVIPAPICVVFRFSDLDFYFYNGLSVLSFCWDSMEIEMESHACLLQYKGPLTLHYILSIHILYIINFIIIMLIHNI